MRLLVTGATGFVGIQVMRQAALAFPGETIGLARRVPERQDGQRYVAADLLDAVGMAHALAEIRPTHLLHLAWNVTPGQYWSSPANMEWLEASLRLIRLFAEAGGQRVVAAGTCAEYDWSDGVLREHATALVPGTRYGIAKDCLRRMVESVSPVLGLSWAWGRLFWIYGPHEREGRLVSGIAHAILAGETAMLNSTGHQRRDYLHVSDVAGALLAVLMSDLEGPVNVGAGHAPEVRHLAELFAQALGGPDLLRFAASNQGQELPVVVADTTRLALTGFVPQITLENGMADTAAWWRGVHA